MIEYQKQDDARRYVVAERMYREGLSALKHHITAGPDDLPVMGQGGGVRTSRLGAWTPAGSGY
jgi:hypothetical protein